ncbi:MAG: hypothetical protein M3209_01770 [Acidobacteriota bacterium]|nr:hypothetical protein [Acidobacteriota bacterium]
MEYESKSVHPTEVISEGWELIKSDYWLFFGITLVMTLIVVAISGVLVAAVGEIAQIVTRGVGIVSDGTPANVAAALVPSLIKEGFNVITTFVTTLISALLTCGIYVALWRKASGEAPDFGDLFAGFKFFQPCLIVTLLLTLFQFALSVSMVLVAFLFGISSLGTEIITPGGRFDPSIFRALIPAFLVIAILYLIFTFIFGVLTFFVYQLIATKNAFAAEAITQSVRAGLRNFFPLIALSIIEGLMAIAGALLCIVGIFFVIPILMAANFAAYLRVFGRPDNLAQHLPPPPPVFGAQPNSGFSQF